MEIQWAYQVPGRMLCFFSFHLLPRWSSCPPHSNGEKPVLTETHIYPQNVLYFPFFLTFPWVFFLVSLFLSLFLLPRVLSITTWNTLHYPPFLTPLKQTLGQTNLVFWLQGICHNPMSLLWLFNPEGLQLQVFFVIETPLSDFGDWQELSVCLSSITLLGNSGVISSQSLSAAESRFRCADHPSVVIEIVPVLFQLIAVCSVGVFLTLIRQRHLPISEIFCKSQVAFL